MGQKNDRFPSEASSTVLIVRFSALGDICMTIPVVYAVCAANPHVRFVYVTKRPVASLFIHKPSNLEVEGVDLKKDYGGIAGPWKLMRHLCKRHNITALADLHSVIRTHQMALYARVCGIKVAAIDKMRSQRQELVSRGAGHATPLAPMTSRYAEVFTRLGLNAPEYADAPVMSGLSPLSVAHIIAPRTPDETWIAIAPFAAHKGKIWPEASMHEVVKAITGRQKTRIILFGGGGHEAELLDKWSKESPGVISLAGKRHGFEAELSIMAQCQVMISMDSANMHLASLVGTPVISIWGATHPAAGFVGWHQDANLAVQASLPCRPCSIFGDRVCHHGDYHCLSAVTPQMVVAKTVNLLHSLKK